MQIAGRFGLIERRHEIFVVRRMLRLLVWVFVLIGLTAWNVFAWGSLALYKYKKVKTPYITLLEVLIVSVRYLLSVLVRARTWGGRGLLVHK